MGLLDKLFPKKQSNGYDSRASIYKMETIEQIQSIPVPTKKFEYNCDFTESIEYVLQRKATQFKKEGNIDLAIECLKKSIEIMPFAPMSYPDAYNRLENYLKLARRFDEARAVFSESIDSKQEQEEQIYNKMITLSSMSDMIEVPRNPMVCSECARFHGRVYAKNGHNGLPDTTLFVDYYNKKQCDCSLLFYPFFENASVPVICSKNKLIEYSNRPFEDDRTKKEKKEYDDHIREIKEYAKDRKDYDWIFEHLPDIAPKSFGGYRNMKHKNSANYQKLVSVSKENGYTI